MFDAVTNVPAPVNEPVKGYAPGSQERAVLEAKNKELACERAELTMTVGGVQRMGGGDVTDVAKPHNHASCSAWSARPPTEDVAAG